MAWLKLLIFVFSTTAFAQNTDVLFIGDSHSQGCFGVEVDRAMRALDFPGAKRRLRVRSMAACSSKVRSWMRDSGYSTHCGFRSCTVSNRCVSPNEGKTTPFPT